jgi:hypothetical protein
MASVGYFTRLGLASLASLLPYLAAMEKPQAAATPSIDLRQPVCIGLEEHWAIYQLTPTLDRWQTTKSTSRAATDLSFTAIGHEEAAILDPSRRYSGWLFRAKNAEWKEIPESPIQGPNRTWDPIQVAATANSVFVWGLSLGPPHGALLDTRTMKWEEIPEAPIALRYRARQAVIGTKVIVWGGYPKFLKDGAIFDLERKVWEKLPEAPIPYWTNMVSAAWNGKFVVFGGRDPRLPGRGSRNGAIYDVTNHRWERITEAPLDIGIMSACTVVGDTLFLWAGQAGPTELASRGMPTPDGAVYDLVNKKWRQIKPAPIPPRSLSFACPLGKDCVAVWGGWSEANDRSKQAHFHRDGAIYNLTTDTWSRLPDLPAEIPYGLHPGW